MNYKEVPNEILAAVLAVVRTGLDKDPNLQSATLTAFIDAATDIAKAHGGIENFNVPVEVQEDFKSGVLICAVLAMVLAAQKDAQVFAEFLGLVEYAKAAEAKGEFKIL